MQLQRHVSSQRIKRLTQKFQYKLPDLPSPPKQSRVPLDDELSWRKRIGLDHWRQQLNIDPKVQGLKYKPRYDLNFIQEQLKDFTSNVSRLKENSCYLPKYSNLPDRAKPSLETVDYNDTVISRVSSSFNRSQLCLTCSDLDQRQSLTSQLDITPKIDRKKNQASQPNRFKYIEKDAPRSPSKSPSRSPADYKMESFSNKFRLESADYKSQVLPYYPPTAEQSQPKERDYQYRSKYNLNSKQNIKAEAKIAAKAQQRPKLQKTQTYKYRSVERRQPSKTENQRKPSVARQKKVLGEAQQERRRGQELLSTRRSRPRPVQLQQEFQFTGRFGRNEG